MSTAITSAGSVVSVRDLVALTKPRVTMLVLITAAGGLWLAPGAHSIGFAIFTLLVTAAAVGSANALNCWLERDVDRFMERTAMRPLPAGRMHPQVALVFGLVLGLVAVFGLTFGVNPVTGVLGSLALVLYVAAYTPMKQWSPMALFVGAIPGALPPLMGWTSVTCHIDAPGLVLFAIMFIWQIPHFVAIALFRNGDYEAAGIRTLPLAYGEQAAKMQAAAYAACLIPVSLLLVPLRVAGPLYAVTAVALGLGYMVVSLRGLRKDAGRRWARTWFFASLIHISGLFGVLILERMLFRH